MVVPDLPDRRVYRLTYPLPSLQSLHPPADQVSDFSSQPDYSGLLLFYQDESTHVDVVRFMRPSSSAHRVQLPFGVSGVKVVNPTADGFSFLASDAADADATFLMTAQFEDEGPGPGPASAEIPSSYAIQQIASE